MSWRSSQNIWLPSVHLPDDFTKDMILSMKGKNVLNILARSVLGLYILDEKPDSIALDNMIKQSLSLIAKFPTIVAYSYQALRHLYMGKTLSIRHPQPKYDYS